MTEETIIQLVQNIVENVVFPPHCLIFRSLSEKLGYEPVLFSVSLSFKKKTVGAHMLANGCEEIITLLFPNHLAI